LSSISFLCPIQVKKPEDVDDDILDDDISRNNNNTVEKVLLSSDKCSKETLIFNRQVSIECVGCDDCDDDDGDGDDDGDNGNNNKRNDDDTRNIQIRSLGPSYFTNSTESKQKQDRFDPAMCSFELTLYKADLPDERLTTPIKDIHQRQRTVFGWISPPPPLPSEGKEETGSEKDNDNVMDDADDDDDATQEKEEDDEEIIEASMEAILIATIDGCTYQLDLTSLLDIKYIVSRSASDDGSDNDESKIPSCLILQFPSFLLRIFSSSDTDEQEEELTLKEVEEKLQIVFTDEYFLPYPLEYDGLICMEYIANNVNITNDKGHVETLIQSTHLQSLSRAWSQLNSLERILSVSQEEETDDNALKENIMKIYLNKILTRIPSNISSSFVERNRLSAGMQGLDHKINTKLDSLDDVLDSFWKTSSKPGKRKRRRDKSHPKNKRINDDDHEVQQDCIDQTHEFLTSHKKLLASKYELSLLPYR
jgi:hypothetical protein